MQKRGGVKSRLFFPPEVRRVRGVSFALQVSSAAYVGNASTSTPYPVPFPVVTPAHVAVTVQVPAGTAPDQLSPGQYTVHDLGGGSYNVTTATAYANTALVTVYRSVPFDQPFEFPEGGILRTSEIERSFDRVVMQIQQLWRQLTDGDGGTILPGTGSPVQSVATFADSVARLSLAPAYTGQIGVQLDDESLWIGGSTAGGDWTLHVPPDFDVWEVDPVTLLTAGDGVVQLERYLGMIPRDFEVHHLRLSTFFNTGVTLYWGLKTADSLSFPVSLAEGGWVYSAGVLTVKIPWSELNSVSGGITVLPAGKALLIDTYTERSYGALIHPVEIAFLGRWLA